MISKALDKIKSLKAIMCTREALLKKNISRCYNSLAITDTCQDV